MQFRRALCGAILALLVLAIAAAGSAAASPQGPLRPSETPGDVHHDVSPPLRDIPAAAAPPADHKKEKEPKHGLPVPAASPTPDPVVQSAPAAAAAPVLGVGFEGIGQGFHGPAGTFSVVSEPLAP